MNEPLPDAVAERKRELRRAVLERRDALSPEERRAKSVAIADRVLSLDEVRSARTVLVFWTFGSEVETADLIGRLHAAGKRVALPRVEGPEVAAVVYEPGDPTVAASFGAMEPTRADVVDPVAIDVVIAPGLAFDRTGARVGYGGGFYDRFLRGVRSDASVIAIAFAIQLVDEVPRAEHDRLMDVVVTEDEVVVPPASSSEG